MLKQLVNGFSSLHKLKIMHRDLKADNVFIKNGKIKIGDFGMAKKYEPSIS